MFLACSRLIGPLLPGRLLLACIHQHIAQITPVVKAHYSDSTMEYGRFCQHGAAPARWHAHLHLLCCSNVYMPKLE